MTRPGQLRAGALIRALICECEREGLTLAECTRNEQAAIESALGAGPSALAALGKLERHAERCARAVLDGDMAEASALWEAQAQVMSGAQAEDLRALAEHLRGGPHPLDGLGAALRVLIEDDTNLADSAAS